MSDPDEDPRPDARSVLEWRAQGLSLAEIGHRPGCSGDRLRRVLVKAGVDPSELRGEADDHGLNTATTR